MSYTPVPKRTVVCMDCGTKFEVPKDSKRMYCSACISVHAAIRKAAKQREERRLMRDIMKDVNDCAWDYCSAQDIMRAEHRPSGCSERRWRMEMKRRADRDYFAIYGEPSNGD